MKDRSDDPLHHEGTLLPLSQDIQIARAGARSSDDQFALLIKVVVGQVHVSSLRMPNVPPSQSIASSITRSRSQKTVHDTVYSEQCELSTGKTSNRKKT